jgi:hypothetical protein
LIPCTKHCLSFLKFFLRFLVDLVPVQNLKSTTFSSIVLSLLEIEEKNSKKSYLFVIENVQAKKFARAKSGFAVAIIKNPLKMYFLALILGFKSGIIFKEKIIFAREKNFLARGKFFFF